jgi:hypothetical protein
MLFTIHLLLGLLLGAKRARAEPAEVLPVDANGIEVHTAPSDPMANPVDEETKALKPLSDPSESRSSSETTITTTTTAIITTSEAPPPESSMSAPSPSVSPLAEPAHDKPETVFCGTSGECFYHDHDHKHIMTYMIRHPLTVQVVRILLIAKYS